MRNSFPLVCLLSSHFPVPAQGHVISSLSSEFRGLEKKGDGREAILEGEGSVQALEGGERGVCVWGGATYSLLSSYLSSLSPPLVAPTPSCSDISVLGHVVSDGHGRVGRTEVWTGDHVSSLLLHPFSNASQYAFGEGRWVRTENRSDVLSAALAAGEGLLSAACFRRSWLFAPSSFRVSASLHSSPDFPSSSPFSPFSLFSLSPLSSLSPFPQLPKLPKLPIPKLPTLRAATYRDAEEADVVFASSLFLLAETYEEEEEKEEKEQEDEGLGTGEETALSLGIKGVGWASDIPSASALFSAFPLGFEVVPLLRSAATLPASSLPFPTIRSFRSFHSFSTSVLPNPILAPCTFRAENAEMRVEWGGWVHLLRTLLGDGEGSGEGEGEGEGVGDGEGNGNTKKLRRGVSLIAKRAKDSCWGDMDVAIVDVQSADGNGAAEEEAERMADEAEGAGFRVTFSPGKMVPEKWRTKMFEEYFRPCWNASLSILSGGSGSGRGGRCLHPFCRRDGSLSEYRSVRGEVVGWGEY